MHKMLIGFTMAVVLATSALPAAARATAAQKCAAAKMRCVAREFQAALACHGRAALTGQAVNPDCLQAAQGKQSQCWQLADSKGGCVPTFPSDHLHEDVADWTADVASDLPSS